MPSKLYPLSGEGYKDTLFGTLSEGVVLPQLPTYRYWRLSMLSSWGDSLVILTEVQLLGADGVKLNNGTMAHAVGHSFLNGNINDPSNGLLGDYAQFNATFPNWWMVDLGVSASVATLKYAGLGAGYTTRNLKDFVLQGSNDGSTFTNVFTGQATATEGLQTFVIG